LPRRYRGGTKNRIRWHLQSHAFAVPVIFDNTQGETDSHIALFGGNIGEEISFCKEKHLTWRWNRFQCQNIIFLIEW